MKLAIISTYPPQKCGVALLTKRLVESFNRLKINLEVITFKGQGFKEEFVKPIIEKNKLNSYIGAANYVKRNNFDIVLLEHEYGINQLGILILLVLLKIYRINIDLVFHTVVPPYTLLKQIPFKLAHILFAFLSRNNFVHTNEAKEKLKFLGNKVKIIPIAIPSVRMVHSKHKPYEQQKRIKLLSFGFITYDKGIDIACEALKNVGNVKLYIVGTVHPWAGKLHFNYFKKIKGYASKYKNIHLINKFVSENEKTKYLLGTDFVILPYRIINQSAILTEVWAHEKIPICSDIKAFKEEIGNDKYGVLFRSDDKDDLRTKITYISKNKNKQETIIRNIKQLKKERGFDKIALRYLSVWKNENITD